MPYAAAHKSHRHVRLTTAPSAAVSGHLAFKYSTEHIQAFVTVYGVLV